MQEFVIVPEANAAVDIKELLAVLPQDATHSIVVFKEGHRIKIPVEQAQKLNEALKVIADVEVKSAS